MNNYQDLFIFTNFFFPANFYFQLIFSSDSKFRTPQKSGKITIKTGRNGIPIFLSIPKMSYE